MQKSKILFWSVINSLGTLAYIVLVALFFSNAERLFGNKPDNILAPIAMLMLFILSATITGGLVLGRPIYLYLNGFKSEAVRLLIYTVICLLIITVAVFLAFILVK